MAIKAREPQAFLPGAISPLELNFFFFETYIFTRKNSRSYREIVCFFFQKFAPPAPPMISRSWFLQRTVGRARRKTDTLRSDLVGTQCGTPAV